MDTPKVPQVRHRFANGHAIATPIAMVCAKDSPISENASMRFSDLPLFLINNTKYEFVAVFQNSHQSQKVADEKESSTGKSCQQHLVLCVYSLKFVVIVTVKVCACYVHLPNRNVTTRNIRQFLNIS